MIPLMILAACAIAAVVFMLTFGMVKKWFKNHYELAEEDKDTYRCLVKARLKSGKFKTIAGIFNDRTGEVLEQTAWQSDKLDEQIAAKDKASVIEDYELD